jgi:RimJ/RimL family protein N-acetyltransferase
MESKKVLIYMGGVDLPNATLKVLKALCDIEGSRPKVTVLLSSNSPNYEKVKKFSEQHISWVTHIDFVDDMAKLLLGHQMAIGAAGISSWERACLGIPSIIIQLAENQSTNCSNLVKSGAALSISLSSITSDLLNAYRQLIAKWAKLRSINLLLCDGLGASRVLTQIAILNGSIKNQVILRKAGDGDLSQVFRWQCVPNTRKYALNKLAPTWEEHKFWMADKLGQAQNFFYIIELSDSSANVGVVRLDRINKGIYLISIIIAPDYYNRGIAKQALFLVDCIHRDITIKATVLDSNLASQKLFTSAKYERISNDTFLRYPL